MHGDQWEWKRGMESDGEGLTLFSFFGFVLFVGPTHQLFWRLLGGAHWKHPMGERNFWFMGWPTGMMSVDFGFFLLVAGPLEGSNRWRPYFGGIGVKVSLKKVRDAADQLLSYLSSSSVANGGCRGGGNGSGRIKYSRGVARLDSNWPIYLLGLEFRSTTPNVNSTQWLSGWVEVGAIGWIWLGGQVAKGGFK